MLFSFLLPVSGLLIQDISSPAAGIAFLWFSYDHGVIWVCSYITPIAPSMDICVLCITQSTSSLFYRLLFVIYHLHLSVAYFYPAARNRIFFTRRLTSGSRCDLFLYFFYVYHSWLMFPHSLSFLRTFTCFLYISSSIDIFGYFPCLLRHTVFCYVLTAAGSRSSFVYYHLSRQQLLLCFICMYCFSITYVWCAYSFRTRYLITYIWCFFFAHVDFPTVLIIRSSIFITYRCLSISGMKTITLFLLSLIYDVFYNLFIIFTSLISDDFSFESGSRTHCIPYICGYFYLLYMMYIRFISSLISDNHLKIRWTTVPLIHSPFLLCLLFRLLLLVLLLISARQQIRNFRHMRYIWHMWCIQSMWQQHG